jgi:hypothetical protein
MHNKLFLTSERGKKGYERKGKRTRGKRQIKKQEKERTKKQGTVGEKYKNKITESKKETSRRAGGD